MDIMIIGHSWLNKLSQVEFRWLIKTLFTGNEQQRTFFKLLPWEVDGGKEAAIFISSLLRNQRLIDNQMTYLDLRIVILGVCLLYNKNIHFIFDEILYIFSRMLLISFISTSNQNTLWHYRWIIMNVKIINK